MRRNLVAISGIFEALWIPLGTDSGWKNCPQPPKMHWHVLYVNRISDQLGLIGQSINTSTDLRLWNRGGVGLVALDTDSRNQLKDIFEECRSHQKQGQKWKGEENFSKTMWWVDFYARGKKQHSMDHCSSLTDSQSGMVFYNHWQSSEAGKELNKEQKDPQGLFGGVLQLWFRPVLLK